MDVEDLALVLKTNLVIIRKRYILGFCTIKALLNLCYQYIIVTLIRDLEGGPYKIGLKFIFEFTKEYLGIKEAKLYIKPRRNKLPLLLRSNLDNIPIKDLGAIIGFRQVTRLYSLRYGVGKAFNKNSNVNNALRNLIIQHADA
ncbi:C2H2 finger domain protein [Cenococcum geophilum]